jgi:serine/threonine protein kinase
VQVPLDRTVAVKILQETEGDSDARILKRKNEFLREAQFTGHLEHPNIVPIHDIGLTVNPEGKVNPFYAMKEIRGVSWQDTIHHKTRQENLQIFKHVVNAIRFAHNKTIIHCDLKPDNVMLGEFGEVLIVDWGQAIDLSDESTMRPGGTPAYISPEMAQYWCDIYLDKKDRSASRARVGYRSDVYLLGALLFEMVSGTAPHLSAPNQSPYEVIRRAAKNELADYEPFLKDELMQIALAALRAEGFEPIETVDSLLAVIHDYETRSHSIELRERAFEFLTKAKEESNYDDFQRARFGFEESLEKWEGNAGAQKGLLDSRLSCAELALRDQNFDLGIGMLESPSSAEERRLREQLVTGRSKRDRRKLLVRLLGLALFSSLIVGVGFNAFMILKNIEYGENRDQALQEKAAAEEELSRLVEKIAETRNEMELDESQNQPPVEPSSKAPKR